MINISNQNMPDDNDTAPQEETASSVISEIIKKYNLKDFDEESIEKLKRGESFVVPGSVINNCAKKIALSIISDREAVSILENSLSIQKKDSEEMVKDIKVKVVPIIQKFLKARENKNVIATANKISKEEIRPLMPTKENIEAIKFKSTKVPIADDIKIPLSAKSKIKKNTEDSKLGIRQNKGPDNYREPIE